MQGAYGQRIMELQWPHGIFVSGRQHSGNTVLTMIIGHQPHVFTSTQESIFFEHRARLDRLPSASLRAEWIATHLYLDEPERELTIRPPLEQWANDNPHADAVAVYQQAMHIATQQAGRQFWARKATSYIFHADDILQRMSNVKLLYMLRNPFDICASRKRRNPGSERIVGCTMSWNRGTQIAHRLQTTIPDRVHVVRYEQLVEQPEPTIRRLCAFIGRDYDPAMLDVPHVNPSEQAYTVIEGTMGLNRSRMFYYMEHLDDAEITAVQMLCRKSLLNHYYPNLPHLTRTPSPATRLRAVRRILGGCASYPMQAVAHARRTRMPLRDYVFRRAQVLLGGG